MSSLLHAAEQLEAEAAQERVSYLDGLGVLAPSVLDVGCGNGYSVLEMQARGMKAVDVDRSLYRFSRWVAEGRLGRQLVIADAAALPFTTAQFNTVTASGMLEHIGVSEHSAPYRVSPLPNKGQARATAVAELRRVTSGVLVLDFPNGWFPIDFWHGDSLGAFRVHRVPDSLNPSLRELLPGSARCASVRGVSRLVVAAAHRAAFVLATVMVAVASLAAPATAQPPVAGLRLYVLDCGTVIYNNPETYNLTRQEVRNTNMSVVCYLVVHPKGALLFDTGLPDATAGRPFNESPLSGDPNPPSTAYFMLVTKTLKSQLAGIGFPADKVDFLVLSHPHRDHVGNANDFAASTWLVQKAEHDAMFGPDVTPQSINPSYAALRNSKTRILEGDHDVFGDGTVVLKHTPGHTPGHQSLYVRLANTGGIVLSGDLYHYPEERTLMRMPEREKTTGTAASRAALEAFMTEVEAQLWIGHDIGAYSKQRKAPEYYD